MALDRLFNASDVIQSYKWLGHQDNGYTELLAIHPAYKQGKENYEHNLKNKAFPKIWYAKSEKQILAFLSKYHGSHLCCYGISTVQFYQWKGQLIKSTPLIYKLKSRKKHKEKENLKGQIRQKD